MASGPGYFKLCLASFKQRHTTRNACITILALMVVCVCVCVCVCFFLHPKCPHHDAFLYVLSFLFSKSFSDFGKVNIDEAKVWGCVSVCLSVSLSVCLSDRPDVTFAVDWTLKNPMIYLLLSFRCQPYISEASETIAIKFDKVTATDR